MAVFNVFKQYTNVHTCIYLHINELLFFKPNLKLKLIDNLDVYETCFRLGKTQVKDITLQDLVDLYSIEQEIILF